MPPVVAAAGAIVGGIVAGGAAVVGAVASVAAIPIVAGITVGTIAYTAVTAYAINALTKKSLKKAQAAAASLAAAQKGYGTNVNAVAPASDHAIIYGTQRVGGVIFYRSVTEDQLYLHSLLALAGHECEEISTIYADNLALTLDADGFVTNDEFSTKTLFDASITLADNQNTEVEDGINIIRTKYLRINKHLGSSTQAAGADLVAEDSAWTNAHAAKGIT